MKPFFEKYRPCLFPAIAYILFGALFFYITKYGYLFGLAFSQKLILDIVLRLLAFGAAAWLLLTIRHVIKNTRRVAAQVLLVISLIFVFGSVFLSAADLYLLLK